MMFKSILNRIRTDGVILKPHAQVLIKHKSETEGAIEIYSRRVDVERVNNANIDKIPSSARTYKCLDNFDWPEFFNAYSRPAKRIELEEERKKRLSKWPKGWLTRKDRRLLKSAPDLAEEWWSDRGRKLLDLA